MHEVVESIVPFLMNNLMGVRTDILERIVDPERVVYFRVPWIDDKANINVADFVKGAK